MNLQETSSELGGCFQVTMVSLRAFLFQTDGGIIVTIGKPSKTSSSHLTLRREAAAREDKKGCLRCGRSLRLRGFR